MQADRDAECHDDEERTAEHDELNRRAFCHPRRNLEWRNCSHG